MNLCGQDSETGSGSTRNMEGENLVGWTRAAKSVRSVGVRATEKHTKEIVV